MTTLFLNIDLGNINEKALVITIVGYCTVFVLLACMVILFIEAHRVQDFFLNRSRKKKLTQRFWINQTKILQEMKMPPSALLSTSILQNSTMKKDM